MRLPASGALIALAAACAAPATGPEEATLRAIDRGLGCVARHYDGRSFRDDYLEFVYADEAIASPRPGETITYRILDAYFIVLMIRQAGVSPGEAGALFERAESTTADLVPAWRRAGIYNLRRHPVAGGIALDTYAILAVLRRDAVMGGVVAAGLDGDGWLPADFYRGEEAFRRLADESWAARALRIADPARGAAVVRATGRQALEAERIEPDPLARANLVIHALEALGDPPAAAAAEDDTAASEDAALVRRLRDEGLRLVRMPEIRRDTLTFANLVGALQATTGVPDRTARADLEELRGRQDDEGCWSASVDPSDRSGRIFTTLRVVLALGRSLSAQVARR